MVSTAAYQQTGGAGDRNRTDHQEETWKSGDENEEEDVIDAEYSEQ